jgi:ABC-2 type transporter
MEQTAINAKRNMIDALRSPAVIYLRAVMYIALAILIGIGWLRIPAQAIRISQLTSVLFFTAAFMIFMSIAVLPVYLNEKQIVTRERSNGSYSAGAYLMGHFIVEIFFIAVLAVVITAVLYYLVGLNPKFSRFCFFALTLFASLLTAEEHHDPNRSCCAFPPGRHRHGRLRVWRLHGCPRLPDPHTVHPVAFEVDAVHWRPQLFLRCVLHQRIQRTNLRSNAKLLPGIQICGCR